MNPPPWEWLKGSRDVAVAVKLAFSGLHLDPPFEARGLFLDIASFRGAAEFGRYRGIADIE
jgi:hypothetical protein